MTYFLYIVFTPEKVVLWIISAHCGMILFVLKGVKNGEKDNKSVYEPAK